MHRIKIAATMLAITLGLSGLTNREATAAGSRQGVGNGSTASVQIDADTENGDGKVSFSFNLTNRSTQAIHDVIIKITPKPTDGGITDGEVDNLKKGSKAADFKVDDNGDEKIDGDSEKDTKQSGASSLKSINTGKESTDVNAGADFDVSGTCRLPRDGKTYTITIKVTNREGAYVNVGLGGGIILAGRSVAEATGIEIETLQEEWGNTQAGICGTNDGGSIITSITIDDSLTGSTLDDVSWIHDMPAGHWDAATKTFTFTEPVQPGGDFALNVRFEDFADDVIEFGWTPNFG